MIGGLRTAIYRVGDLEDATAWFTDVVGHGPYFDEPFYVGFDVDGYELGLVPASGDLAGHQLTVYWATDDVAAEVERLTALGAELVEPPHDVGEGIVVATVTTRDGAPLGLIFNPHFGG